MPELLWVIMALSWHLEHLIVAVFLAQKAEIEWEL
jgi:hypothetical protein